MFAPGSHRAPEVVRLGILVWGACGNVTERSVLRPGRTLASIQQTCAGTCGRALARALGTGPMAPGGSREQPPFRVGDSSRGRGDGLSQGVAFERGPRRGHHAAVGHGPPLASLLQTPWGSGRPAGGRGPGQLADGAQRGVVMWACFPFKTWTDLSATWFKQCQV